MMLMNYLEAKLLKMIKIMINNKINNMIINMMNHSKIQYKYR